MQKFRCSGMALKRFACACMLIDHIGASCLELGLGLPYLSVLYLNYIPLLTNNSSVQMLLLLNCILRSIGRLAFPIFAFFLVEGFLFTKNVRKYLLRLVCFGLISEPLFDFAFFGTLYYPGHQNVYTTLSIALLALILLERWQMVNQTAKGAEYWMNTLFYGCAIFTLAYTAEFFNTDYGALGVLLMITLYLFRRNKTLQHSTLICLTVDQFPAPFAAIPLALYDSTRGAGTKWERWAYYVFYPAHLLLLGLISNFIL